MILKSNIIKKLKEKMKKATSYTLWQDCAKKLDYLEGNDIWQSQDESDLYHYKLVQVQLNQMREYQKSNDLEKLADLLHESLHRHLGEVSNPLLYQVAHTGTKLLIHEYLNEVVKTMNYLCEHDIPGISLTEKLELFEKANHNFGCSALMLSGGGSFGIYHVGVVKALWEQNLLPRVISGSSMGAIVAGGICTRTDEELKDFFSYPEKIYRKAINFLSPWEMLQNKVMMDADQLLKHISINVGNFTFKEAFERTGRILNITVSPTRSRQKPRVLNYMTSPDLLITNSALASCAIPGLFPPVSLKSKDKSGQHVPYAPTEKWIDGSVHSDLPVKRISRLHNVNHYIVSQANPHILPFITHQRFNGVIPSVLHYGMSMVHAQIVGTMDMARKVWWEATPWRPLLDKAYAIVNQSYLGDINIQLAFDPFLYPKVMSNPDLEGLKHYILEGERATWPQISIISDQTKISMNFERCIKRLKDRIQENKLNESIE